MLNRGAIGVIATTAALLVSLAGARAFEDAKYPDLKGQWVRIGNPNWAPAGAPRPPLTAGYQAVFDANRKEMAQGEPGNVPSWYCLPQGMPMMMNMYDPMEVVITPEITYILISHVNDSYRRIYTDGRDWPHEGEYELTYAGYSIGRWIDEDGDGRYDTLEVETRLLKMPHTYDASGIPFHEDNQAVIKERIHLDKANKNIIEDEITVFDHALTHPWSILKKAGRDSQPRPFWHTDACAEGNSMVKIGEEAYFESADGKLMPIKPDQSPPDLSYFRRRGK
ncbi:MAG TPA: hypothetical protein VH684_10150 [Xanthobacteraceae bacterium]|jgi:hypothetical protein